MKMRIFVILCAAALAAFGQTTAPNPVQGTASNTASSSFLSQMIDPLTITEGAYVLSQVASGTTDWKWTLAGKSYNVSAAQRTGITAAAVVGAAALVHKYPKLKPWLTGILAGVSAYYGGRAYWNSQQHGTPATAPSSTPAAAIRIH